MYYVMLCYVVVVYVCVCVYIVVCVVVMCVHVYMHVYTCAVICFFFRSLLQSFNSATIAEYAYIYMAQPLGADIPPFCLACLGTDQRFTAQHVLQRWQYIYSQCTERGISVVSFGGDGDSKVMKAMRVSVLLLMNVYPQLESEKIVLHQPNSGIICTRCGAHRHEV